MKDFFFLIHNFTDKLICLMSQLTEEHKKLVLVLKKDQYLIIMRIYGAHKSTVCHKITNSIKSQPNEAVITLKIA